MSLNNELLEILVSWALFLSPCNLDSVPLPIVKEKPHTFFVENVCGIKKYNYSWGHPEIPETRKAECNVLGWYNNDGIIYIDKNIPNNFKDEVVVHESAHYIQDLTKKYDNNSCVDSIYRELEANRITEEYTWITKGKISYNNIHVNCKK